MIKVFVFIFFIFVLEERDIYIYYKNEERYDSVFYILVSGVIVLIMVLCLNVICKFIFLLCNYFYYLFMGLNNILLNVLLMELV